MDYYEQKIVQQNDKIIIQNDKIIELLKEIATNTYEVIR